ncbi:MotA/TolQ/ExbB proton channel family protein [candidate division KSB1 bacterium]
MWQAILDGGIMMIPLGICSILAVAVILERMYSLRRKNVMKQETLKIVNNIKNREDVHMAISVCRETNDSFSNIVLSALQFESNDTHEIKEAIEDKGRQEVARLEKGLVFLETIAGIAPLLGLLGTVLGMIEVFDVISLEGEARTVSLSSGISQALITTVAGLSIGIVALVFFNLFSNKAENLVLEIEKYSSRLLKNIKNFQ